MFALPNDSNSSQALGWSSKLNYEDIDHGQLNPQMCNLCVMEIYDI
jgi:hypothetical protein